MSDAFKCNRCQHYFDSEVTRRIYDWSGDITSLLFLPSERATIDLCPTCDNALKSILKKWWELDWK